MFRIISLQNSHRRWMAIYSVKEADIYEKAEQLLRDALEKSHMYKNDNLYVENMSAALVEFQNHPWCHPWQRIGLGHSTYKSKTAMTVGVWNVGREAFCDCICQWDILIDNQNK